MMTADLSVFKSCSRRSNVEGAQQIKTFKNLNGDRNNKAKTKAGGSGGGGVNQCSRSALG